MTVCQIAVSTTSSAQVPLGLDVQRSLTFATAAYTFKLPTLSVSANTILILLQMSCTWHLGRVSKCPERDFSVQLRLEYFSGRISLELPFLQSPPPAAMAALTTQQFFSKVHKQPRQNLTTWILLSQGLDPSLL
jgi:hypothetical protein